MNSTVKVLIADDDEETRSIIELMLKRHPQYRVIASVRGGRDTLAVALSFKPDLVLIAAHLPDLSGLHACQLIREAVPRTKVLIIGNINAEAWLVEVARQCRATGLIDRANLSSVGVPAIESVVNWTKGGPPNLDLPGFRMFDNSLSVTTCLTPREWEVAKLAGIGRTNQEIAGQLGISPETVKTHMERILKKLGIRQRRGLRALFP